MSVLDGDGIRVKFNHILRLLKMVALDRLEDLITSYYSTIQEDDSNCQSEPIAEYKPYNLFSLRTKIVPYMRKLLKMKTLDVRFGRHEDNDKLYVTIVPQDGNGDIPLSDISSDDLRKIQGQIDYETSERRDYSLVYCTDLSDFVGIEKSWILTMIPLLDIPDDYYGNYEIIDGIGYLYLNLTTSESYSTDYNDILASIVKQLTTMYEEGYVLGANKIEDDWMLERMDTDDFVSLGYYKPSWINKRLAPNPVKFLQDLIVDPDMIKLKIPDSYNYTKRYYIAREMIRLRKTVNFDRDNVYISPISNLEEAEEITSDVFTAAQQNGRIVYLRSESQDVANYYAKVMDNILPFRDGFPPLVYTDEEISEPYVAISLIDSWQNMQVLQQQITDSAVFVNPRLN